MTRKIKASFYHISLKLWMFIISLSLGLNWLFYRIAEVAPSLYQLIQGIVLVKSLTFLDNIHIHTYTPLDTASLSHKIIQMCVVFLCDNRWRRKKMKTFSSRVYTVTVAAHSVSLSQAIEWQIYTQLLCFFFNEIFIYTLAVCFVCQLISINRSNRSFHSVSVRTDDTTKKNTIVKIE